jgi:hypothetical protein
MQHNDFNAVVWQQIYPQMATAGNRTMTRQVMSDEG